MLRGNGVYVKREPCPLTKRAPLFVYASQPFSDEGLSTNFIYNMPTDEWAVGCVDGRVQGEEMTSEMGLILANVIERKVVGLISNVEISTGVSFLLSQLTSTAPSAPSTTHVALSLDVILQAAISHSLYGHPIPALTDGAFGVMRWAVEDVAAGYGRRCGEKR